MDVLTRGDLSSLQWIESPLKYFNSADHPDHQLCRVHYAALNCRDVMLATGTLPPDAIPGICAASNLVVVRGEPEICFWGYKSFFWGGGWGERGV